MTAPQPTEPTLAWFPVGRLQDLTFDPGAAVTVAGHELAVFRRGDGYVALADSCTHAGGPLAGGDLDGDRVRCPWHGWAFDLETGACSFRHGAAVASYRVRLVDGELQIELPTGD